MPVKAYYNYQANDMPDISSPVIYWNIEVYKPLPESIFTIVASKRSNVRQIGRTSLTGIIRLILCSLVVVYRIFK